MQIYTFLDRIDYTELMFYLSLWKDNVMVRPIQSRGLKMAHERLVYCSIDIIGEVLEKIAIDIDVVVTQHRRLVVLSRGKR